MTKTKKMKIPEGYSEQELIRIINKIANRLAQKFVFGYHSIEDIEQQARLFAIEGIPHYDGRGSLENFLFAHTHNRLHNYKRDNFERFDKPCKKCPIKQYNKKLDRCKKYNNEYLEDCEFYYRWILRNNDKRNLMQPINLDSIDDKDEHNMWQIGGEILEEIEYSELISKIKNKIPMDYMESFNRFVGGAKLSCSARAKIKDIIMQALEDEGYINVD